MNNIEILKKIVEKANKFGDLIVITTKDGEWDNLLKDNAYYGLIFNHKFAKAFWGAKLLNKYDKNDKPNEIFPHWLPAWQYHLQQMVLYEKPLDYLSKFL